jgi:CMP/dCMP kinase
MVVTIDGPAGAGKSSVARQLANRIEAAFLDTGALYRAATLAAMDAGVIQGSDSDRFACVANASISICEDRVFLDGRDVSSAIRAPDVTANIRFIADDPLARERLSELQREFARENPWLVTEGRDQGTEVFPTAECKIFLTASDEERARRRLTQLQDSGIQASFDDVLASQKERDHFDRNRPVGALREAEDSIVIFTDGLTEAEVLDELERIVRQTIPNFPSHGVTDSKKPS